MSVLDYPACTACGKHASDLKKDAAKDDVSTTPTPTTTTKMLVCSRCQSNANRLVHYCSRECQVSHYKVHKPICGVDLTSPTRATIAPTLHARPDAPFQPPQSLLFHLAALTTLPPTAWPAATSPPSFLFFPTASPSSSGTAPDFIPIVLPEPARNLFNCLQLVAFETGNPISVNLMYSILLDEVAALGGAEARLVEQLSQEYRLDGSSPSPSPSDDDKEQEPEPEPERRPTLRSVIDDESEPSVEQLFEAIGGQKNTRILVDWQVYESERKRTANAAARQKEQQEGQQQSKGMRRGGARKGRR
ncbi:hypothetical protein C6P46_001350 [Rhodotorula mucilaginosa]|uniref:MYND-type domain-containing protein n=1 Tax=Rhodotorula mucilaginosa TaxID=5537 RepID=A0A9P6VVD3_RHOMI|nr:hypothetical protein C6P46_001350 [Rhodotorula mucilaginosa]TKA56571.1 hypothetical protein B0A53_01763 [Rhodotorula sp. CCFEE 5036]